MTSLDISMVTEAQRSTAVWAAALLQAIARDETAGRRTQRLTEPKLDTWARFRGRLNSVDLVSLLFEDAAVLHPIPFDPSAIGGPFRPEQLPESLVEKWLSGIAELSTSSTGADYILEQSRLLGLPTRLARSELHIVKPHHKVLELPGTGGQLAHHLANSQRDITLQDNFVIACGSWQELTLAGIVGLELAAPNSSFAVQVNAADIKNPTHPLRSRSFDIVIGLHPDKGGLFRIEDQLALWFPTAKVLLV